MPRDSSNRDRSAEYARQKAKRAEARALRPKGRTAEGLARRAEYNRQYRASHPKPPVPVEPPIPPVFPDLQRGYSISFWEEELLYDLRQERTLAELEGRDPDKAEAAYRAREFRWRRYTLPLLGEPDEAA